mmetsp:Transcript_21497/g.40435  ORF Transcript_21497/g.40435 Transcript_21497/m.40435 type:complete len:363 (-) Transcript_21497:461-1549(-)
MPHSVAQQRVSAIRQSFALDGHVERLALEVVECDHGGLEVFGARVDVKHVPVHVPLVLAAENLVGSNELEESLADGLRVHFPTLLVALLCLGPARRRLLLPTGILPSNPTHREYFSDEGKRVHGIAPRFHFPLALPFPLRPPRLPRLLAPAAACPAQGQVGRSTLVVHFLLEVEQGHSQRDQLPVRSRLYADGNGPAFPAAGRALLFAVLRARGACHDDIRNEDSHAGKLGHQNISFHVDVVQMIVQHSEFEHFLNASLAQFIEGQIDSNEANFALLAVPPVKNNELLQLPRDLVRQPVTAQVNRLDLLDVHQLPNELLETFSAQAAVRFIEVRQGRGVVSIEVIRHLVVLRLPVDIAQLLP